jgi:hypothetical protein
MGEYNETVKLLRGRRQGLVEQLGRIDTAIKALGSIRDGVTVRRKPKFTKAGLERIAAAQRARWAKVQRHKVAA